MLIWTEALSRPLKMYLLGGAAKPLVFNKVQLPHQCRADDMHQSRQVSLMPVDSSTLMWQLYLVESQGLCGTTHSFISSKHSPLECAFGAGRSIWSFPPSVGLSPVATAWRTSCTSAILETPHHQLGDSLVQPGIVCPASFDT